MIGLLAVLGCAGPVEDAPPPLPLAAEQATFATLTGLGSYRMQASVRRATGGEGTVEMVGTETVELRWKDADHWSYVQRRDDRVRTEVVVWDAVAWANGGQGPLVRKGDAEPYRVQLAATWDPWERALESLAASIRLEPVGADLVDGRRAQRHTLVVVPPPEKRRRGWTVTAVEGDVWIDEATAVRLQGNVRVEASSGARTRQVALSFAIDGVGLDPEVSAPRGDKP
ncbi:MAG: hypothetical protein Q8P41_14735 [Pseudomonadota bacterium]|nr:hypothetical protein [Pseudomonadota bacterium]